MLLLRAQVSFIVSFLSLSLARTVYMALIDCHQIIDLSDDYS